MKKDNTNDLINNVLPALFKKHFLPPLDAEGIESAIKKKAASLDKEIDDLKIPKKKEGKNTNSSKIDFSVYENAFDISSIMFFQALLGGAYESDKNMNFYKDERGNKILKMTRRKELRNFALKLFSHYFAERLHRQKEAIIQYLVGLLEYPTGPSPIEHLTDIAETDDPVSITGESGTGKELLAKAIHYLSRRKEKVYISINCGGINEETLQSELFGHVKGAFTGAADNRQGAFEAATGGTLFLDEIGDMPSKVQVALLRVLNNGEFIKYGAKYGSKPMQADVRVIAATNKNLRQEIKNGNFREDLYYRLCVHPMRLPSFRDLPIDDRVGKSIMIFNAVLQEQSAQDIVLATVGMWHYRPKINGNTGQCRGALEIDEPDLNSLSISKGAMELLINHPMPGNYRQLYSIIKNAWVKTKQKIEVEHLSEELLSADEDTAREPSEAWMNLSWSEFEKKMMTLEKEKIKRCLKNTSNNVTKAAREMGIPRHQLDGKIKKFGLLATGE